jgi:beta-lactamase class A
VHAVERLLAGFDGRAGVYARDLGSGTTVVAGEADRAFPTGSAAKLLVLLAFAEGVAASTIDPTARVEVTAPSRDARGGSGVLRHLSEGLCPTLEDCATLMMIVSDNVATDLLLDAVGGPGAVNAACGRLGCHDVEVTAPSVWVMPPAQFGMATPQGLAEAWAPLAAEGPVAERCRRITWRHQQREGFARLVPFRPDLPDFGMRSPLGLWSKSGSYPTVSCEAGLFRTAGASWVLAVMADEVADWGNGSAAAGPSLRAEVSRAVYDAWGGGGPG